LVGMERFASGGDEQDNPSTKAGVGFDRHDHDHGILAVMAFGEGAHFRQA
jgi:hypothetical protein